jgi:hypothetical protein
VVEQRTCENCQRLIAQTARPDKRYCSRACKQLASERRRRERADFATVVEQSGLPPELARALMQATDETRLLAQVAAAAARGQWRAAAWILERRYPERWSAPARTKPEPEPEPVAPDDPFTEVDELAKRRRQKVPT